MRRRDLESKHFHEPGQPWCLSLWKLEHEPRQRRRVDDWVLERAFEATTDEPRVERVVAVLHEHRAVGETEEGAAGVLELGRADQHRAVDVMALPCIRIDRRAAVDERVKERKRGVESKTFSADLEHKEGRVARGLNIKGDELSVLQQGVRPDLRSVDGDLFPRHQLGSGARLEKDATRTHPA